MTKKLRNELSQVFAIQVRNKNNIHGFNAFEDFKVQDYSWYRLVNCPTDLGYKACLMFDSKDMERFQNTDWRHDVDQWVGSDNSRAKLETSRLYVFSISEHPETNQFLQWNPIKKRVFKSGWEKKASTDDDPIQPREDIDHIPLSLAKLGMHFKENGLYNCKALEGVPANKMVLSHDLLRWAP